MSLCGSSLPCRTIKRMSGVGGNLLQNSKMRGRQNSAARPSGRVFGDPTPCKEPTKAAGWNSDQSCDPLHKFRIGAPAPLENFVCSQKQSFATQSGGDRTCRTDFANLKS